MYNERAYTQNVHQKVHFRIYICFERNTHTLYTAPTLSVSVLQEREIIQIVNALRHGGRSPPKTLNRSSILEYIFKINYSDLRERQQFYGVFFFF